MTGEEFLSKVRAIKTITDIHWHIEGDELDPDEVKVVIVADGEKIEVIYPREVNSHQNMAIALLINKLMEQVGDNFRAYFADDIAKVVNYSRKLI